jgi:hypothetical protein
MLKFSKNDPLRVLLYEERIRNEGYVYVDAGKMRSAIGYERARAVTNGQLARRVMAGKAGAGYADLSSPSVLHYLQNHEKIPAERLKQRKTQGLSLDSKKVLKPLIEAGRAVEFLNYYTTFTSLDSRCNRIEKLLKLMSGTDAVSNTGQPISRLYYNVFQQENMRYNYSDTDLISIPREYNSCYTVPKGYVLAWGDLAQADFRIAYNLLLRDERNAPIMDACSDKYEGMARILADFFNEEFDEAEFKAEREVYKVNVLQTIYGQKSGRTPHDFAFIKRFREYLGTCPRYQEYLKRISERMLLGLPVPVTGYFCEQEYTQFVPYSQERPQDTVNKCLNTPNQTGTSQVVILLVNKILDMFQELGYGKEDVSVYMVRHDEPIFMLKEEVLRDAWVFEQAREIIIDNWTPMALEFSYGYYYKETADELVKKVNESIEANRDKLVTEYSDELEEVYYPVAKTFMLDVGFETVGDETIVSLYEKESHSATYLLVKSTNMSDVYASVRARLLASTSKLEAEGFTAAVVHTNGLHKEDIFENGMFYKVKDGFNSVSQLAYLLAHWAMCKYANRERIPFVQKMDLLKQNQDTLESVGELVVLKS